jgi:co-chaperonin GroES (HSP10)
VNLRMYADNVLVELEPLETMSPSGLLHIPQKTDRGARGSRFGRVLASGPGYYRQRKAGALGTQDGTFIPNETKPGDRVVLDAQAGDAYAGELSVPRHNAAESFGALRIVRESEIHCVVDG